MASLCLANQIFDKPAENSNMMINKEFIEEIKAKTSKWTPLEFDENPFRHKTRHQFKKSIGTRNGGAADLLKQATKKTGLPDNILDQLKKIADPLEIALKHPKVRADDDDEEEKIIRGDTRLPNSYDIRKKYPECVAPVHDQKLCGAQWAFASSGMLSDRFCIQSQGQIKVDLSAQDMINCSFEDWGCEGGSLVSAVDFLQSEGTTLNSCNKYKEQLERCRFKCDKPKT